MSSHSANTLILRAGQTQAALDPSDRGLAYGDGLFETILVHAGQPVWWPQHWQRLQRGAKVLALALPDEASLRAACDGLLRNAPSRCVLKLIITRGSGGRGYRPPEVAEPVTIISWHPMPQATGPVRLRWCELRWARQPRLAGIKHLNRLEQVLARAEWSDPEIFDGLVCDTDDQVISATSANVFAFIGGRWQTPPLVAAGIAGLARAWVLQHVQGAIEAELSRAEIESAEALFLCNALRGILVVRQLEDRHWAEHPALSTLLAQFATAEPAFAFQES